VSPHRSGLSLSDSQSGDFQPWVMADVAETMRSMAYRAAGPTLVAVDKQEVIAAIRRLTDENGGVPVGLRRFVSETGTRQHEVIGKYWARWGDALEEAGYSANEWNPPIEEEMLLSAYVVLARGLGKLPTVRELALEARTNPGFPANTTYRRRFGSQGNLAEKVRAHCLANPGNEDVLALCPEPTEQEAPTPEAPVFAGALVGYVYLLKSGRFYKIGRSNDSGRRNYEIRLQQPESVKEVWEIKTDDPVGIEAYWHKRFADKRVKGEWFDLRRTDVDAFKRWRRII
jgi:hypothetical protein